MYCMSSLVAWLQYFVHHYKRKNCILNASPPIDLSRTFSSWLLSSTTLSLPFLFLPSILSSSSLNILIYPVTASSSYSFSRPLPPLPLSPVVSWLYMGSRHDPFTLRLLGSVFSVYLATFIRCHMYGWIITDIIYFYSILDMHHYFVGYLSLWQQDCRVHLCLCPHDCSTSQKCYQQASTVVLLPPHPILTSPQDLQSQAFTLQASDSCCHPRVEWGCKACREPWPRSSVAGLGIQCSVAQDSHHIPLMALTGGTALGLWQQEDRSGVAGTQ